MSSMMLPTASSVNTTEFAAEVLGQERLATSPSASQTNNSIGISQSKLVSTTSTDISLSPETPACTISGGFGTLRDAVVVMLVMVLLVSDVPGGLVLVMLVSVVPVVLVLVMLVMVLLVLVMPVELVLVELTLDVLVSASEVDAWVDATSVVVSIGDVDT
jgi:hypothetical protein